MNPTNNYQTYLNQNGGADAVPASGSQPNFIEKLLPTAGSILGGLAGTATDAFDGPLGTIGGSALGSSLGKAAENALTGQSATSGLGTAAIEGGVGGGVGEGANALLGVGKGVLQGVADTGAGKAADAAANVPWQGIAGTSAAKTAELGPTLDKMASYGIDTTPEGLAKVTPQITGGDGAVLSDLVRNAMEQSTNPVDLTGTRALASNIASSPQLAEAGPTVGTAFAKSVNNILGLTDKGTITDNAAPDVYQARQLLMNKAYDKGTSDALSSAYHDVAQSLDDALTRSGVDNTVVKNGLSDDQFSTLNAISPQLAHETAGAATQNVGALRSLQKPFVNASNLARAAQFHAGGQLPGALESATTAAIDKATGDVVPNGVVQAATLAHPVLGTAAKLGSAAINNGAGISAKLLSKVPANLLPVLSQIAAHVPSDGSNPASDNPTLAGAPGVNPYQTTGQADPNIGQQIVQAGILDPTAVPALQGALKAQSAQPILSGLEGAYGNAGGGQGLGGGLLSQLSSYIPGTAAYQYHQQEAAAASSIAQALGISPQAVQSLLPSLMANPQGASSALQELQGGINTAASPATGSQANFSSVLPGL